MSFNLKSWWKELWGKAKAELERIKDKLKKKVEDTVSPSEPPAQSTGDVPYGCFLGDGADTRYMDLLNPAIPEEQFRAAVDKHLKFGANQMLFAVYNEKDGGSWNGYSYYTDGAVDQDKIEAMKARLRWAIDRGVKFIELWGRTDDSPVANAWDESRIINHYEIFANNFGEVATSLCVCLEYDDCGKKWTERVHSMLVKILQKTGLPVAVHYRSYTGVFAAIKTGADRYNAQTRGNATTAQMRKMMDYLAKPAKDIDIVACEFHQSSFSPAATELATIAMSYSWCKGTQTGRPTHVPSPAETPGDSTQDAFPFSQLKWGSNHRRSRATKVEGSLQIKRVTRDNIYFEASKRDGYPTEQDGGTIDGRCYLFNKDGSGGFYDSIRPNQQSRDFKNVKSGYCKGFKYIPGEICYTFIGDIDLNNRRGPIAEGLMT
jgi:hypothetical protein